MKANTKSPIPKNCKTSPPHCVTNRDIVLAPADTDEETESAHRSVIGDKNGANRKRTANAGKRFTKLSYLIGETAPQRRVQLLPFYLGAFLLILSAVGILFMVLPDQGQWWQESRQPAQHATSQALPRPLPRVRLPSIVNQAKKDPAFSAEHPGWTRYQAESLEFRLFREGKSLRAVQVFCLNDKTVTDEFYHSFVRELSSEEPPPLTCIGENNGFAVERGFQGTGAECQVYRQTANGRIRGFVVALP